MPAIQIPGTNITYGWQEREDGWSGGMNTNLVVLGYLARGSVLSRSVGVPPADPDEGDRYIVPVDPSGEWAGHDNEVAMFLSNGWVYIEPFQIPMLVEDENFHVYWNGAQYVLIRGTEPAAEIIGLVDVAVEAAGTAEAAAEESGENRQLTASDAEQTAEDRQAVAADRLAAESAAESAARDAQIYPDTATALDSTAEGDYFSVPAAEDAEAFIIYRHDAGPVATELGRTPSAQSVESIKEKLPDNEGRQALFVFADEDDAAVGAIYSDGSLELAGMDESVQSASERIPEDNPGGASVLVVQDSEGRAVLDVDEKGVIWPRSAPRSIQSAMASNYLFRAMRESAAGNETAARYWYDRAENEYQTPIRLDAMVAPDGLDNSIQRIPAVTKTPDGRLLVVWQQILRPVESDGNGVRLVYALGDYSSDYGTISFQERLVFDEPADWANNLGASMHPALITLPSGRILCAYNVNDAPSGLVSEREMNVYLRYSDDNGETWSARSKIWDAPAGTNVYAMLGSGGDFVRIPSGEHEGRLVLPIFEQGNERYSIYSDDDGVSWLSSPSFSTPGYTTNESALAFVPETGALIMSFRNEGYYNETYAESSDGGESWVFRGPKPGWQASNCARSMVQVSTDPANGFSKLLWTGLDNAVNYSRQDFVLRVSHDGGVTYQTQYVPWVRTREAGYSNIKMLDVNTAVVVWENGFNSANSIFIMILNMAEVYRNGDSN
ncbi:MAG: DUF2793 domain-containing protein [Alcanivorax sp.]|nr:DUF2793 domain-containing protein [Alcanivorax sp.]